MAKKGKRSKLFKKQPNMLLFDERVSTIVLPKLPPDHKFEDDEEDILFAEEVDTETIEPSNAAPLRVFLGSTSDIKEKNESEKIELDNVWDLSGNLAEDSDDVEVFDEPPVSIPASKPVGLATLHTASMPIEEGVSNLTSRSVEESLVVSLKQKSALDSFIARSEAPKEDDNQWDEDLDATQPFSRPSTGAPVDANQRVSALASLSTASMPIEEYPHSSQFEKSQPAQASLFDLQESDYATDEVAPNPISPVRFVAGRSEPEEPLYDDFYNDEFETDEDDFYTEDLLSYDEKEKTAAIEGNITEEKTVLSARPKLSRPRMTIRKNSLMEGGIEIGDPPKKQSLLIVLMIVILTVLIFGFFAFAMVGEQFTLSP